jgi:hypothetical protein
MQARRDNSQSIRLTVHDEAPRRIRNMNKEKKKAMSSASH